MCNLGTLAVAVGRGDTVSADMCIRRPGEDSQKGDKLSPTTEVSDDLMVVPGPLHAQRAACVIHRHERTDAQRTDARRESC